SRGPTSTRRTREGTVFIRVYPCLSVFIRVHPWLSSVAFIRGFHSNSIRLTSGCTRSPALQYTLFTLPSPGARTRRSIFIPPTTITVWPLVTVSPAATFTLTTVAGIGDERDPCVCCRRRSDG